MDKHQKLVLFVVVLGSMMASIDASIILLAFPDMVQSLGANISSAIWTIAAYLLIIAAATTQLGRLGDIYGRAKMFNAGFAVFTVSSALCGAAPSIAFLVFFRIFQAIGAALLVANSGAIIADYFERESIGRAYGFLTTGWAVGSFLGIVLGGVLTTFFGWRYIFYINVPIGIIGFFLGLRYLKDINIVQRKLDIIGMLLLMGALLSLAFAALDSAAFGATAVNEAVAIFGVVLVASFILFESKVEDPMVDMRMLAKNHVVMFSMITGMLVSLGYFSVFFMITLYLQGVRGLDPLNSALLLLPASIVGGILGPRMGRMSDKYGARIVATGGILAYMLAILIFMTITPVSPLYVIALASTVSGLGVAMFFPANNSAVMRNTEAKMYGSVNGLLRTMQNTGTLLSYAISFYVASLVISRQTAFSIFVGTTQLAGGISAAFVSGVHTALTISFVILAAAALMSLARGRRRTDKEVGRAARQL